MRRCFLSLALLTLALGCADEGEAQRRLDDIRTAYSAAIKQDFVSGLHGEEVARVLRALDQFERPDTVRDEAIALAAHPQDASVTRSRRRRYALRMSLTAPAKRRCLN